MIKKLASVSTDNCRETEEEDEDQVDILRYKDLEVL
jgi:hypothetical protein